MEVRWLEAFVAVAEELHFGRAAARLHMAQSPLSQVIQRLEREVGAPLFVRSTRSVALTASGEALLPFAYRTLHTLRSALDAARSAQGVPTGRCRLGFSGVHNHQTLPRLAQALRRDFPTIDLQLVGGVRTFDGIRLVRNGELDAAFIGLVSEIPAPLRTREISRQHVGVVVPADHALADNGPVSVSDLRGEPFVMGPVDGNSSMTVIARQICQSAGFTPEVAQTVSDPFLILSMVAAGTGITLMTSEVIPVLPEAAVWVELDGEPVIFRHGVIWSDENESVSLQAFLSVLDDVYPASDDDATDEDARHERISDPA
ncbi:MAG: LysR family transcriptional regulator [Nocardioides sp.]|uniref:LysR family transcriptional regulator n=1 Tax=Nocardioides sp. TaxID=35761 RepID=UPI003D6A38ED